MTLPDLPATTLPGLYVHIPFCFHKCHYCDFYSITRQTPERMSAFVDRLLGEARRWADSGVRVVPRTAFFGGGTPSLLPLAQMARLLEELPRIFDFSQLDEWTVECNPATVDADYCAMLRAGGVNRLSFGAQSFAPGELKTLERHHNPDDVPRSLQTARDAGFLRLSVDLIYAIPGQTLASWQHSLETALKLGTRHLSCYGLTYEANTPIAVKKRLGQMIPATDEVELEMLRYTRSRLRDAGMPPYEISNYAAPGEECRHNLLYWTGGSYIGIGPSAASHVEGTRWRNRPHLGEWEKKLDAGELPVIETETLTPPQRAGELAFLELRLSRGLDIEAFNDRTGLNALTLFADPLSRYVPAGLLELTPTHIKLTEQGIAVADALSREFVVPV